MSRSSHSMTPPQPPQNLVDELAKLGWCLVSKPVVTVEDRPSEPVGFGTGGQQRIIEVSVRTHDKVLHARHVLSEIELRRSVDAEKHQKWLENKMIHELGYELMQALINA